MNQSTPFSIARWEYEEQHLFYLTPTILEKLELDKPLLIEGGRGTGKTTLLQSLNWSNQTENESLKKALTRLESKNDYSGVYLKVPESKFSKLTKWEGDENYAEVVSIYIELLWLEAYLSQLVNKIETQTIEFSVKSERELLKELTTIKFFKKYSGTRTLLDFVDVTHEIRKDIELSASYDKTPENIIRRFCHFPNIGELGASVGGKLFEFIGVKIKVCLDECETLSKSQSKVLMSLIRLSKSPVFYIFSFVRLPEDTSTTYLPNLTVNEADVDFIKLDELSREDFKALAQGIVMVRLRDYYKKEDIEFSFDNLLGLFNVNEALQELFSTSENKNVKNFTKDAEKLLELPYFREEKEKKILPLFQKHLMDELDIKAEEFKSKSEIRKSKSQGVRKKYLASYLSVCNKFRIKPIYYGENVFFYICDKSIRDCIHMMKLLYLESKSSFDGKKRIINKEQDKVFKEYAKKKLESFRSNASSNVGGLKRFVDALAKITTKLQSNSENKSHLRSVERGKFTVDKSIFEQVPSLKVYVREAAEAGYVKLLTDNDDEIEFRVHSALSPHYKFSFRDPVYEIALNFEEVKNLVELEDENSIKTLVNCVSERLNTTRTENHYSQMDMLE